jgi:hypothetical protein
MRARHILGLLGSILLSTSSCSSPGPAADEASAGGTSVSAGSGQCMQFATTNEGCQIGGPSPLVCPATPKGWSGTATPGEACSDGTDCKGIICKCDDPVQQWYVGVCACGSCANYDVACEEANVVSCKKIGPQ